MVRPVAQYLLPFYMIWPMAPIRPPLGLISAISRCAWGRLRLGVAVGGIRGQEDDLYALFRLGARRLQCDLSVAVDLPDGRWTREIGDK